MSSIDYQNRWNVVRDKRSTQQLVFEKLLKFNAKRRELISHVKLLEIIIKLLQNFKVKKDKDRRWVISMFLAIKIAVKFNYSFKRKNGIEQKQRYRLYSKRIFTFNAMMMHRIAEQESKLVLARFLHQKDTFVKFKLKT